MVYDTVISAVEDRYQDCYDEVESLGSIPRIPKLRVAKGSVYLYKDTEKNKYI